MKVLAFAASNSKKSINKQLAQYTTTLIDGASIELIDLNDYEMPIYSADREAENGIPQLAHDFLSKITGAEAVIISFAEHNGSYAAAYKNIFDWMSRIQQKVFKDKKMILLATSPGPGGAANVLSTATSATPHFGGLVLASISVPKFYDQFDAESGKMTNAVIQSQLESAVQALTA